MDGKGRVSHGDADGQENGQGRTDELIKGGKWQLDLLSQKAQVEQGNGELAAQQPVQISADSKPRNQEHDKTEPDGQTYGRMKEGSLRIAQSVDDAV